MNEYAGSKPETLDKVHYENVFGEWHFKGDMLLKFIAEMHLLEFRKIFIDKA